MPEEGPASYGYLDLPRTDVIELMPSALTSLLDVGCGLGGFGRAAKSVYPDIAVTGIESNPTAAQVAATRYDRVVVGEFPQALRGEDGRYGCVAFLDVLEHMVNPWEAVVAARDFLHADGIVVASIPNVRYWNVLGPLVFEGQWRYEDSGVMDRTHLRFFTRSSIEHLFRSAGYVIRRLDGVNLLPVGEIVGPHSRWLRAAARARPALVEDLRAQQYVVSASVQ